MGIVWKSKSCLNSEPPFDATRPTCVVYAREPGSNVDVLQEASTDAINWKQVRKYQAYSSFVFPETDEVWGTRNDYETEEDQLKDTYAYSNVTWVIALLVALLAILSLTTYVQ